MMRLSYNDMKSMKVGEVYYESSQYNNTKFILIEKPKEIVGEMTQLVFKGSVEGREDVNFLVTKGLEHYGPKIYKQPAYVGVQNIGF